MTDPEHTPKYLDLETETEMFEALARDLAAMPARIRRARQLAQDADDKAAERWAANRAELAGHRAAIEELSARQTAEHEARKKELAVQRAELAERERAADEKFQRGEAQIRMAEMRAADLGNRERRSA
jgi:hypothetical protein